MRVWLATPYRQRWVAACPAHAARFDAGHAATPTLPACPASVLVGPSQAADEPAPAAPAEPASGKKEKKKGDKKRKRQAEEAAAEEAPAQQEAPTPAAEAAPTAAEDGGKKKKEKKKEKKGKKGEAAAAEEQPAAVAAEPEGAARPAKKQKTGAGGAAAEAQQQAGDAQQQADEQQQQPAKSGGTTDGHTSDGGYVSSGREGTAARAFQRVKADEWLNEKGSWDNSYEGTFGRNGWGWKAQEVLGKVRALLGRGGGLRGRGAKLGAPGGEAGSRWPPCLMRMCQGWLAGCRATACSAPLRLRAGGVQCAVGPAAPGRQGCAHARHGASMRCPRTPPGCAALAVHSCLQVRGKDFRHEKTKKKRGSYKGGEIDPHARCSYKFESDDE